MKIDTIRAACAFGLALAATAGAQPLMLDGLTGGQLAPWALVAPSPQHGTGKPVVAHHYLDAGPVVGDVNTAVVALGFDARWEAAYAHYFVNGPTPVVSSDLDALSLKYLAVQPKGDRPAIAVGGTQRISSDRSMSRFEPFVVGTRVFSLEHGRALLTSAGLRDSGAAIYGIGGKTGYRAVGFGTLGLILDAHFALGVELYDQPGTDLDVSYWVRIIPHRDDLQILFAIAHVQDSLGAGSQFTSNVSYRF